MDYCMLSFLSTHAAISAQKLLDGVCPVQTMPVLREISAGCGIALRLAPEHLDMVRKALSSSSLSAEVYSFYTVSDSGGNLSVEKL